MQISLHVSDVTRHPMNLPISSASSFAVTLQGLLGLALKADITFNGVDFAYRRKADINARGKGRFTLGVWKGSERPQRLDRGCQPAGNEIGLPETRVRRTSALLC